MLDINQSNDTSSFASSKLSPRLISQVIIKEEKTSLDSIPDDHYDDVPLADKN